MWVKIIKEHLRRCPECHQLCLKIPDSYDGQYLDDVDELGVCRDCLDELVAAIPSDHFDPLLGGSAHPERPSEVLEASDGEN